MDYVLYNARDAKHIGVTYVTMIGAIAYARGYAYTMGIDIWVCETEGLGNTYPLRIVKPNGCVEIRGVDFGHTDF